MEVVQEESLYNTSGEWVALIILALVLIAFFTMLAVFAANSAFGVIEILYIFIFRRPLAKHFVLFKKKLEPGEESILFNYSRMYRSLPDDEKAVFEHRVVRFMEMKNFIGQSGFNLTRTHKIIISSIAVKLTFGLRRYSMPVVKKIIVFPSVFKNLRTGNAHKGEFNPNTGHIAFSWRDLMEGIEDPNDNLHLGLHEFTHALVFELLKGSWADTYFKFRYADVEAIIKHPKNAQYLRAHPYLRQYAHTNSMEFFAVAVEHFFETPDQFRRELPLLYEKFSLMLNIDPMEFNAFTPGRRSL
jgi:Mlc titration factor MtfA (ptsG expression regulator)